MFALLRWLRITFARASSGRSGGGLRQRILTPPHTRAVVVLEMPPSRFMIVCRGSIRSSARVYACRYVRTHARGRIRVAVCICLCLYGGKLINAASADDSHFYRLSTMVEETSGSENAFDAFLRFSHVASYEIFFPWCEHFTSRCARYVVLGE